MRPRHRDALTMCLRDLARVACRTRPKPRPPPVTTHKRPASTPWPRPESRPPPDSPACDSSTCAAHSYRRLAGSGAGQPCRPRAWPDTDHPVLGAVCRCRSSRPGRRVFRPEDPIWCGKRQLALACSRPGGAYCGKGDQALVHGDGSDPGGSGMTAPGRVAWVASRPGAGMPTRVRCWVRAGAGGRSGSGRGAPRRWRPRSRRPRR
jgi:hypothetical protein